ncbi:hypothetical protein DPMN_082425 [Dreissena polymorpha]|uniref:Uncharacterized protein n=1 Tax=Dreissena polymorpha TaxID=45954 RepID=A0A9D3Y6X4_DREPO|nr:hypothetical protein DPMN_082425 [Dreissena polymorpha]
MNDLNFAVDLALISHRYGKRPMSFEKLKLSTEGRARFSVPTDLNAYAKQMDKT